MFSSWFRPRFSHWIIPIVLVLPLLLPATPVSARGATPGAASPIPASGDFDGLVDIGNGRRLYLTCRGSGSPTVLLEAGAGNNAQIWEQLALPPDSREQAVFPAVAGFTRVCAYDRPGTMLDETHLSRSDPAPGGPRTAEAMVADLHALIEAAQLPTPLVLVGHSFGGLIVRLYTNTYPEQVAGLVFIDAAHEEYYRGLETLLTSAQWALAFDPPMPADAPPFEAIDALTSAGQVVAAQAASPLPEIPAIVLTHGGDFPFPADFPVDAIEQVWSTAQHDLAALIPGTPVIVASESSHYIQLDRPDLVIDAIRTVVDAVHDPATWSTPIASPQPG